MKCKAWWLKLFAAILLSIGCILQVKTSLDKFLSGKTTVAIQKRKQVTAPMPVVVVCPYNMFRLELMETNNMTFSSEKFDKWPNKPENVENAWKNTTFPLSDLVTHITAKVSRDVRLNVK